MKRYQISKLWYIYSAIDFIALFFLDVAGHDLKDDIILLLCTIIIFSSPVLFVISTIKIADRFKSTASTLFFTIVSLIGWSLPVITSLLIGFGISMKGFRF